MRRNRNRVPTLVMIAFLGWCGVLEPSCAQQSGAEDPCSEKSLATVVAFCVARAKVECGSRTYDECARAREIQAECEAHIERVCEVE